MSVHRSIPRRKAIERLHRRQMALQSAEPVHVPMSLTASLALMTFSFVFVGAVLGWVVFDHQSFEAFLQWAGKSVGAR